MTELRISLHHNARAARRGPYPFQATLSADRAELAFAEISRCPLYAPTPLADLPLAAERNGVRRVIYKDEGPRFGLHSFKALGGAYAVARLLSDQLSARLDRPVGPADLVRRDHAGGAAAVTVACASDGNHGRSVAAGAKAFGCACVIFLHEGVSAGREAAVTALGAQVVRTPGDYDASVLIARETSAARGWTLVSDTAQSADDPVPAMVLQGYSVMMLELQTQLDTMAERTPTHVFLQGGVGGLAAAVVAQLWESLGPEQAPIFVVVEPERADCLYQSAVAGRPTPASGDLETLMAGLACGEVSQVAWPILAAGVEFFMTIPDEAAVEAMRLLADGALGAPPIVAGESAVAGLAALLAAGRAEESRRRLRLDADSLVLLIGSEGATDPEIWRRLVGDERADRLGIAA